MAKVRVRGAEKTGTWVSMREYWVIIIFLGGGANNVLVICRGMALGDSDETFSQVSQYLQLAFGGLWKSGVHIPVRPQHGEA